MVAFKIVCAQTAPHDGLDRVYGRVAFKMVCA